ncbi:DUF305 domain-containing protein [Streptomyces sp. NPDC050448]|uniref:DUF305 domain-containing protein n=1 Tax=Streptomyces sp. NPDC050448 TaxID=3155404 RepID=UPI0034360C46
MNVPRRPSHRVAMVAAVATAVLVVTGCGGNSSKSGGSPSTTTTQASPTASPSASAPAGQHNQADVTFAQGMIPHHRQAIVMADMAEQHASSSDVKALAQKIKKAQTPEIETMTTWLKSWGEAVPQGMGGMGHGNASATPGMDMGMGMGMMSDHDMDQLKGATGNAFDTMFLTMMIKHHEGAVEMANTEKQQGAYGPAKEMAGNIVTSQTAEITQMRKMLGTASPSATATP